MSKKEQELADFELPMDNIKKAAKIQEAGTHPPEVKVAKTTEKTTRPKKGEKKLFNWRVHKDLKERFANLTKEIMVSTEDFTFRKRECFELCVNFYVDRLHKKGQFMEAPENFVNYIQRSGKRPFVDRYPRGEDEQNLVLEIDAGTYGAYLDLIYSEAVIADDVYNESLSTKYYLYDLVGNAEKELKKIIMFSKTL